MAPLPVPAVVNLCLHYYGQFDGPHSGHSPSILSHTTSNNDNEGLERFCDRVFRNWSIGDMHSTHFTPITRPLAARSPESVEDLMEYMNQEGIKVEFGTGPDGNGLDVALPNGQTLGKRSAEEMEQSDATHQQVLSPHEHDEERIESLRLQTRSAEAAEKNDNDTELINGAEEDDGYEPDDESGHDDDFETDDDSEGDDDSDEGSPSHEELERRGTMAGFFDSPYPAAAVDTTKSARPGQFYPEADPLKSASTSKQLSDLLAKGMGGKSDGSPKSTETFDNFVIVA